MHYQWTAYTYFLEDKCSYPSTVTFASRYMFANKVYESQGSKNFY